MWTLSRFYRFTIIFIYVLTKFLSLKIFRLAFWELRILTLWKEILK